MLEMLTKKAPTLGPSVHDQYSLMKYQKRMTEKTGHYVLEGNYHNWFKEMAKCMIAYNEQDRSSFAELKERILK